MLQSEHSLFFGDSNFLVIASASVNGIVAFQGVSKHPYIQQDSCDPLFNVYFLDTT